MMTILLPRTCFIQKSMHGEVAPGAELSAKFRYTRDCELRIVKNGYVYLHELGRTTELDEAVRTRFE